MRRFTIDKLLICGGVKENPGPGGDRNKSNIKIRTYNVYKWLLYILLEV